FALVACAVAGPVASGYLGGNVSAGAVRIAVAWMWFTGVLYLLQEQLRWQLRPRQYAITSLVNVTVTAAASSILVLALDAGIGGFFGGQALGAGLAMLLSFLYLLNTYRFAANFERLREMLRFSLPLVPGSIGIFLSGFVDRIAIKAELGLA